MKFINLDERDYHIHSSNFSDGTATIEEIVKFAGDIGLKEIAITDHSSEMAKKFYEDFGFTNNTARFALSSWQNVHNDVNVIFGVEGDLLNEDGDVCFDIQGFEPEFIILSVHKYTYNSDPNTVTKGLIKAIEKYHDKIKFIGHPDSIFQLGDYLDMVKLIEVANKYNIPLEFNAYTLIRKQSNLEKLHYMLKNTNLIYINSDAHSLYDLKEARKMTLDFLKEHKYI